MAGRNFILIKINSQQIICVADVDGILYNNRGISVKGLYDNIKQDYSNDINRCNILAEVYRFHDIGIFLLTMLQ
jgi:hypothetical protein